MKEFYQSADWKTEKHVPVIEVSRKGDLYSATVTVGKEIPHPNTTAHHIEWIELYFHPAGEKFPYMLGRFEFSAHGASIEGADSSAIYTHPEVTCNFKSSKSGMLHAASYCNIHGLWSGSAELPR